MSETQELTFAKRLKEQTTTTHDSVDNLVMSVQPFSSKENYIKFLKLQSVFHKAVDHIYKDAELNKAIPELEYMARYDAVTQDLKDLGEELADVVFVVLCLANQTGIDLQQAFDKKMLKKTERDHNRHHNNEKLK